MRKFHSDRAFSSNPPLHADTLRTRELSQCNSPDTRVHCPARVNPHPAEDRDTPTGGAGLRHQSRSIAQSVPRADCLSHGRRYEPQDIPRSIYGSSSCRGQTRPRQRRCHSPHPLLQSRRHPRLRSQERHRSHRGRSSNHPRFKRQTPTTSPACSATHRNSACPSPNLPTHRPQAPRHPPGRTAHAPTTTSVPAPEPPARTHTRSRARRPHLR